MVEYNKCKYYCLDTVETLTESTETATPLYTGSTYGVPGVYSFMGKKWDMTREGLYVISYLDGVSFKIYVKIITAGIFTSAGTADIKKLMSAISWNHVHGTDDNNSTYQTMSNAGAHRKWRAQCGVIAGLAAWLVPQLGYQARVVNVSTNESLNNFDNGHIVVETRKTSSDQWVMWDLTNARYFTDENGDQFSASDFISHIANGGDFPTINMLSLDDKTNSDTTSNVDLHWYLKMTQGTDAEKESWYRRIFQKVV